MKIAILSDVHDNIWKLEALLAGLEADSLVFWLPNLQRAEGIDDGFVKPLVGHHTEVMGLRLVEHQRYTTVGRHHRRRCLDCRLQNLIQTQCSVDGLAGPSQGGQGVNAPLNLSVETRIVDSKSHLISKGRQ